MLKTAKLLLIVFALSSGLSAQGLADRAIEKAFSATDSQIISVGNYKGFEVPSPTGFSVDATKSSSETADPYLYLPISIKGVYEYEFTSSEFQGTKKVVVEFKGYSEKDSMASASITYFNKNSQKSNDFTLKIADNGIISSDTVLAGARIEIPFPLFKGKEWTENSDKNRVSTFSAKISVPAGNFENCLKITTRIGGGDAGVAERYYAPNLGLVMETVNAEDKQETLRLVSFKAK
ncbi:MAG: hypothetical protein Fur0012_13800 [Elusimicrobiota bacterium]